MDIVFESSMVHGKPKGRRERKKLDTRRRIFTSAFELFREKGFEATTVEEIAERADVGKGTVFNYFPQKTAFLLAAYQEWVALLSEELGPVDSWTGSAQTQLGRVFSHMADLTVKHRELARQVIFENMRQTHLRMAQEGAEGTADARRRGERRVEREGEETANAPDRMEEKAREGQGTEPGRMDNEPEAVRVLETMTREVVQRGRENAEIRSEVDVEQATSLIAAAAFHTLVRGLVQGVSATEIKANLVAKMDIIFTGLSP